jgi:hypothetical protein
MGSHAGGAPAGSTHRRPLGAHGVSGSHLPQTASVFLHISTFSVPPVPPHRTASTSQRVAVQSAAALLHFPSFPHAWPGRQPVVEPGTPQSSASQAGPPVVRVPQTRPLAVHDSLSVHPLQAASRAAQISTFSVSPAPPQRRAPISQRVAAQAAPAVLHTRSFPHACSGGQPSAEPAARHTTGSQTATPLPVPHTRPLAVHDGSSATQAPQTASVSAQRSTRSVPSRPPQRRAPAVQRVPAHAAARSLHVPSFPHA